MTVTISSALAARIVADANANPEIEVCGLLIGEPDRVDAIRPAANVANDPARHFEVDPAVLFDALRAEREGRGCVVGHYHSHPTGRAAPSATDAAMIRHPGELWLIAAAGTLTAWRATDEKSFYQVALVLA